MFRIKMADIIIDVANRYRYVREMCADYIIEKDDEAADLIVCATDDAIMQEMANAAEPCTEEYCESICIYRAISECLIRYNGFLLHGACIEKEGEVYAFCAASGTGKSTHLSLWKKHFGDKVRIINGDKPIIRLYPQENDKFVVYGTPWCGKEGWNINTSGPLKAICFLERGKTNEIRPITAKEAVKRLGHQILMPKTPREMTMYLDLLDVLLREIPCYLLSCNMEEEAAEVAYRGMNH